jgi:hypothetical protein
MAVGSLVAEIMIKLRQKVDQLVVSCELKNKSLDAIEQRCALFGADCADVAYDVFQSLHQQTTTHHAVSSVAEESPPPLGLTTVTGHKPASVRDYVEACEEHDVDAFCQQSGQIFLVHTGQEGELMLSTTDHRVTVNVRVSEIRGAGVNLLERHVFPAFHSASTSLEVAKIGRVREGNDIVLPYESVSAGHASLTRGPQGELLLYDEGSKNGTFVNDEMVSVKEHGKPAKVDLGDRIRFGAVALIVLSGNQFYELVGALTQ